CPVPLRIKSMNVFQAPRRRTSRRSASHRSAPSRLTYSSYRWLAAPTMVRRLVEEARKSGATGDGIKTIVYGGGPMYLADIKEALSVLGPRFVQIYGQGESPM